LGFEAEDLFLSAKIGQPIQEIDANTAFDQAFGTTGQGNFATVPNIQGQPVKILKFPKTDSGGGYYVPPGAAANGGGSFINQYTIICDILFPVASSGKVRALFQTDSGGQAEFFVNAANQIGIDGGTFAGTLTPNTWHRVAFAVDLAATTPSIAYFIDGVKVFEGNPGAGVDSRWAIPASAVGYSALYFDNDDTGETEEDTSAAYSFAMNACSMSSHALGGPTADGIPTGPLPEPYVISALPSPESTLIPERSTVSPRPLIQLVIVDGTNAVDTSMVTMQVDASPVVPSIVKVAGTNTISYTPPAFYASN
jgi:hypothetical protein